MSIKAIQWVWDHSQAGGSDRLVMLAIADNADEENFAAWPSVSTLAKKTLLSERAVQYAIGRLKTLGELEVEKQQSRYGTNVYKILRGANLAPLDPGVQIPASEEASGVQISASRGADSRTPGVQLAAPEPSVEQPSSDEPSELQEPLSLVSDEEPTPDPVHAVFAAWVQATGRSDRTTLTPERKRLIEKWLKFFDAQELMDAARGITLSAFHMGDNEQKTKYNGLEHVLKNAANIEKFRDYARGNASVPKPKRDARSIGDFSNMKDGRVDLRLYREAA